MYRDPFLKIYSLIRQRKGNLAISMLMNGNSWRISGDYRHRCNHAWYCVGDILFKKHQFVEAKKAFKCSLRSCPDDVAALMAIGNCYDELKKPKYAERYFRRALLFSVSGDANYEDIVFNLANSLFDQNQMHEAINLYRTLITGSAPIKEKAMKNIKLIIDAKGKNLDVNDNI